ANKSRHLIARPSHFNPYKSAFIVLLILSSLHIISNFPYIFLYFVLAIDNPSSNSQLSGVIPPPFSKDYRFCVLIPFWPSRNRYRFGGSRPNNTKFRPSRDLKRRPRRRKSEKQRGGGKEILLKVGVHEHMVDSSTAAEAAETEATNEHKQTGRKPEKTRAQKDAHNASCRKSRLKRKMEFEELAAKNPKMKKKLDEMQVELQSMYTKLEERNSEITLLKTALQKLGTNFTSFKELEEWIISQKYEQVGQGSGPNDTNVTATAAAGPSFVATHDHSPNNAAGNKAGFSTPSAAGPFSAAYHFDFDNDYLFTDYDDLVGRFSTPSDAGPFSAAYHFDFDNDYLFTDYDDLVGILIARLVKKHSSKAGF
ncbi:hypothetical protein POUND7_004242, partial [Theobroma cacao]